MKTNQGTDDTTLTYTGCSRNESGITVINWRALCAAEKNVTIPVENVITHI